jgi:hypothetical protein
MFHVTPSSTSIIFFFLIFIHLAIENQINFHCPLKMVAKTYEPKKTNILSTPKKKTGYTKNDIIIFLRREGENCRGVVGRGWIYLGFYFPVGAYTPLPSPPPPHIPPISV